MEYQSTRTQNAETVSSAYAIKNGLASDGGLYMPVEIPKITLDDVRAIMTMPYPERTADILSRFLTDYTKEELLSDCKAAYTAEKFRGGTAPVHALRNGIHVLELWHGPTAAFKDMALQIMPHLLSRALTKLGEKRTALILVATSGDTGKAALEGYKDVKGTKIKVYYPVHGVSRVQKLQMMTQEGDNVSVTAIDGNFDDAQTAVKKIFADPDIREELNEKNVFLSSANSINWGRLVPQIVYYVSAYADLCQNGTVNLGDEIDVAVPTGNFGNIFAAYLAKKMGLPIRKLICASNQNNVLTDFLRTGTYDRNRTFYTTISPSMDILISSNLERLLYLTVGAEKTSAYMKQLSSAGKYCLDSEDFLKISKDFVGYFADETATKNAIKIVFRDEKYCIDPHTAVGYAAVRSYQKESGSEKPVLLASTASPYKFAGDVLAALGEKVPDDALKASSVLAEKTGTEVHYALRDLDRRTVRFDTTVAKEEIADTVLAFAGI